MRTIRIGRRGESSFNPGEPGASKMPPASETMTEEQRASYIESVMRMPKEKRVSALRSVGLGAEADELERSLAEEHLRELELDARRKRLAELDELGEEERISILIAEGFEEEAKLLSEKMANEQDAEGTPAEDGKEAEKPKKRGRRTKKQQK